MTLSANWYVFTGIWGLPADLCKLFDYLSFFPARNNIPDSVMTDAASSEGLFPPGKFFQARYAALALQAKLREQIRNVSGHQFCNMKH